ncbi:MAG: PglB [Lachnospira sp.]|nr:PglB [Lachnospira sp.]
MKLLILGAGGHGKVCGEIARKSYEEIAFLDDNAPGVIGRMEDYEKLKGYESAFVALGNPELREEWIEKLIASGYQIATIVSEKAVVSKLATIGEGSVVMGGAVVQTGAEIGSGCIVSAGAVVDHDAKVGSFCHINCNAVIPAMKIVADKLKVNYGQIYVEE